MAITVLTSLDLIKIPLPDYFSSADLARLRAALTKRTIYGTLDPVLSRENFSKVDKKSVSHTFSRFTENGEVLRATLNVLDTKNGNKLLRILMDADDPRSVFTPARRMNNDPWRLGNDVMNAPGFFAIDVKLRK